jgi:outer membrane receptor protein involved in Fe transport
VEYGEDATVRAGAEWAGVFGSAPLGIAVTRLSSDGVGPRDEYTGWSGTGRAEVPVSANDRLRLSALGTDGDKQLPYDFIFNPGPVQIHDPNIDENDRLAVGAATWRHKFSPAVALEGEGSILYGHIHYVNGENQPGGDQQDTHLKNTRDIGALRLGASPGAGARVILGAEYRGDQVDRTDESVFFGFPAKTRVDRGVHSRSLYADGHAEWKRMLLLDAGIRVDDHSVYGAFGLPRVAAAVLVGGGVKLRGGYGRAFTAPTLSDLYYPGYSDTTLNPERSTTWEAGADGRWLDGRLTAQATYHHTEFKDLIQSNSFFAPDNIGSARIEGEEYAIGLAPRAGVHLRATAAHLIATKLTESDPDPDRRLAKRPAVALHRLGRGSAPFRRDADRRVALGRSRARPVRLRERERRDAGRRQSGLRRARSRGVRVAPALGPARSPRASLERPRPGLLGGEGIPGAGPRVRARAHGEPLVFARSARRSSGDQVGGGRRQLVPGVNARL